MKDDEKNTSPEAASAAAKVMQDGRTSDRSKSVAASALSQAGEGGKEKSTSPEIAAEASDVLRDEDTGKRTKSAAASALSQAEKDDKK
jgi:hypothetical protein